MRALGIVLSGLVLLLTPGLAGAEGNTLSCKISLWQVPKSKKGAVSPSDAIELEPRTSYGKSFSTFELELDRVGGEAWLHQNMCVGRRDFRSGRFLGTLCVVVMTAQESEGTASASALVVDVSRLAQVSQTQGGKLLPPVTENLGGFRGSIPIDASGKTVSLTQFFPPSKSREGDLAKMEIACGG
ncbi:MAG: hypothetical protein EBZ48_11800 [Proteobacteria bacterium]|nr:hypothetical protein [Pseudomonadota bacterium]